MTFHQPDVPAVPLIARPVPDAIVRHGRPEIRGRILSVAPDRRTARVVWQMSAGAVAMAPDPSVTDLLYALEGRAEFRVSGQVPIVVEPGTMYECPHEPYELWVDAHFKKISVLHHPDGLALTAEPV